MYNFKVKENLFNFVMLCFSWITNFKCTHIYLFFFKVFGAHSSLLSKGFAMSHPPTISQALEGNLPFATQTNEGAFLRDFVTCAPGTSGGRLAA